MNEPDGMSMQSLGIGDALPESLWSAGELIGAGEEASADPRGRLVTLGFIKAAVKRRARFLLACVVVGLIAGAGLYFSKPPAYSAEVTLLLDDSAANSSAQIQTDAALAQSTAVGEAVISQLNLGQGVPEFLGSYVVTTPSAQVLVITLSAPTSGEAVQRAQAVATQFLAVRAQYANAQQQQLEQGLNAQLALSKKNLTTITNEVNQLQQEPSSPQQKAQLATAQAQEQTASNNYGQTQQNVIGTVLTSRVATQAEIKDSRVINAATPLHHSTFKTLLLYIGGGAFGGLVVGLAIIAIGALTSDRLRRRDDVAYAIGSPVRLSVGPLRESRVRLPGLQPKVKDRDMRSVVDYLRTVTSLLGNGGVGSLAVVAVDDVGTVARTVVSLALSNAKEGKRVLLADLSQGRHAARLLGEPAPGVQRITSQGAHLVLAVPDADEVTPIGPFRARGGAAVRNAATDKALVDAGLSADLVLSLVTLDPRGVSDHLRTWASDAVAVVTAGESTAERVHSIGEMVRQGGAHLGSTVLLGADPHDESLGVVTDVY